MKRSKIGLTVVASLILNTVFIFQPAGVSQVEAVWPGYNGGNIVFGSLRDGNFEIYAMNTDGVNAANLSNNPSSDWVDSWSPDGSKVLFRSVRDGNIEIYTMNDDGSGQTRLTNAVGTDANTQWSPDGSKIIFNSMRDGNIEIYSMNADGTNQVRLTNNSSVDGGPQWSPDGSKILFDSNRDGNYEIYIMNSDGSDQTRLTNVAGTDARPQWSPDGSKILLHSSRDGNTEIYIMNSDGSDQTRLTNTPSDEAVYATSRWSPEGQVIAVSREDDDVEVSELVLINVNDLTEEVFDYTEDGLQIIDDLSWSPDGQKLLINGYHESDRDTWDQYVVDADGSNLVQLTNDGESGYGEWQPIPNTPPVLASKTAALQSGASSLIDVLAGSTDEEVLSGSNISISTPPSHGSASIEAGKVEYTADQDYAGTDSLVYEVCDSFMLDQQCATKTLNITVKPSLGLAKVDTTQTTGTTKVETTNTKPTFSGTTTPLAQVTVEIHSDPVILTTTADQEGNWSVTPPSPIPSGDHTVYISSTLNGQTTALNSFVLGISETIPNTGATTLPILVSGGLLLFLGLILYYYDRRYNWRRHMPPILKV